MFFSLSGFAVSFIVIGFLVRKKMSYAQGLLQDSMQTAQKRMQWKVQQFQSKPGGNVKQLQRQLEADQQAMCKQGLELTQGLRTVSKMVHTNWTSNGDNAFTILLPAKKF